MAAPTLAAARSDSAPGSGSGSGAGSISSGACSVRTGCSSGADGTRGAGSGGRRGQQHDCAAQRTVVQHARQGPCCTRGAAGHGGPLQPRRHSRHAVTRLLACGEWPRSHHWPQGRRRCSDSCGVAGPPACTPGGAGRRWSRLLALELQVRRHSGSMRAGAKDAATTRTEKQRGSRRSASGVACPGLWSWGPAQPELRKWKHHAAPCAPCRWPAPCVGMSYAAAARPPSPECPECPGSVP